MGGGKVTFPNFLPFYPTVPPALHLLCHRTETIAYRPWRGRHMCYTYSLFHKQCESYVLQKILDMGPFFQNFCLPPPPFKFEYPHPLGSKPFSLLLVQWFLKKPHGFWKSNVKFFVFYSTSTVRSNKGSFCNSDGGTGSVKTRNKKNSTDASFNHIITTERNKMQIWFYFVFKLFFSCPQLPLLVENELCKLKQPR